MRVLSVKMPFTELDSLVPNRYNQCRNDIGSVSFISRVPIMRGEPSVPK